MIYSINKDYGLQEQIKQNIAILIFRILQRSLQFNSLKFRIPG